MSRLFWLLVIISPSSHLVNRDTARERAGIPFRYPNHCSKWPVYLFCRRSFSFCCSWYSLSLSCHVGTALQTKVMWYTDKMQVIINRSISYIFSHAIGFHGTACNIYFPLSGVPLITATLRILKSHEINMFYLENKWPHKKKTHK